MRIRKYSPLWWAKKALIVLLGASLICMMGLSDSPKAEAIEQEETVIEENTYTPLVSPEAEPFEVEPIEIGEFTVTAYCACEICCGEWSNTENPLTASGEPAVEGITVGADWNTIPAGTVIYIDGLGERTVQDKPANWIVEKYDGKIIDVYFSSHEEALAFGKRTAKVWKGENDD